MLRKALVAHERQNFALEIFETSIVKIDVLLQHHCLFIIQDIVKRLT